MEDEQEEAAQLQVDIYHQILHACVFFVDKQTDRDAYYYLGGMHALV